MPLGSTKTFAEMSMEEKNIFSHRRKATDLLLQYLSAIK
jgi:XTP/dITP diphosphohydrolase